MTPIKYVPLEGSASDVQERFSAGFRQRKSFRKYVWAFMLLAGVSFFVWNHWIHEEPQRPGRHVFGHYAPKTNIWADLDEAEFEDILTFLFEEPNDLNLTKKDKAGPWDNHIAIIEALVPNKTDALKYLDSDAAEAPPRYARVIVNRGATEQASIDDYMVGPLPTGPNTTITPLSWVYNSGRNSVKNPLPNYEDIVLWFAELGAELSDMIDDLLGEVINPEPTEKIPPLMAVSRPAAFENGTISSWARVHSTGLRFDAWSLLAQGMYCRFEIMGRDSSNWAIREWFYDGILYNSTESFRKAWQAGNVRKIPPNVDGDWSAAEPSEKGVPERDMVAPVMIQPGGPRYRIDEKERHITWLGWSFYVNSLQAIGLGLWDVKFDGERILYELGLQEAMAHYAGNDPLAVGMYWLDTLFGMGFNSYELVPGYDCPAYATFLPMSFHQGEQTIVRKNSLCVFEWTASDPIQRHTSQTHVTVSRNNYLIVRHVATVGNYDYTISYIFYLDGTMEVKVQASGYIFGAYNSLEAMRTDMKSKRSEQAQYEYGYQIHDFVASSMHDHVISFKADFDIVGTQNTLYRVNVAPFHKTYQWEDSLHRSTMRLFHEALSEEGGLDWPANSAAMYVLLNNESTNAWGEKRGYRITPGTGMGTPPHLTIHASPGMAKAASWAYHDLWLLKHHEQERRGAHEYNAMYPEDPLIDFGKMVDGEKTLQEDLVVYFNLGSHHVPHSGDVPNTLMHTSGSSVMFVPMNFHDRDPSRERAQGAKLTMQQDGTSKGSDVQYFGGQYKKAVNVPLAQLEPDLSKYTVPDPSAIDLSWNSTLAAL
ncbi:uncharacterized protein PV09_00592 [Verruconis gallopava]|uniref:Amine oxidase n=1 Tax=Verruconis gallopava TaxID=253628 RepID=A0A0D1Y0P0_9PEZI|nr:uncharacterized protein PV09_00592 [Verruconis gallopava]KIW08636.1 hypothetical protein PV09_00592 [Verruconis gallopava]